MVLAGTGYFLLPGSIDNRAMLRRVSERVKERIAVVRANLRFVTIPDS
jgi:hypothetical protein